MNLLQHYGARTEVVQMACRPGQLIHQNGDKNVAQALTQLHILIIRCEIVCIMHDIDGLYELHAQGNPGGVELLFLT